MPTRPPKDLAPRPWPLTDEHVLAAMDPNGATTKYGEIVAQLEIQLGYNGTLLYRTTDRVLQRMRRLGKVELVKGPGAGWRIIKQVPSNAP